MTPNSASEGVSEERLSVLRLELQRDAREEVDKRINEAKGEAETRIDSSKRGIRFEIRAYAAIGSVIVVSLGFQSLINLPAEVQRSVEEAMQDDAVEIARREANARNDTLGTLVDEGRALRSRLEAAGRILAALPSSEAFRLEVVNALKIDREFVEEARGRPGVRGNDGNDGNDGVDGTKGEAGPGLEAGTIVAFFGSQPPDGWVPCDGRNDGMPDLRDRFIRGTSFTDSIGFTGGETSHTHTAEASAQGDTEQNILVERLPVEQAPAGVRANLAVGPHIHSLNLEVDLESSEVSNLPPYTEVMFLCRV